jgi:rhamnulokinase/L-fuculokinase
VCGIPVTAGPVEATVMGNAAIQLLRNGAIRSEADIPVIIGNSEKLQEFSPQGNYDRQYEDFKKIIL